MIVHLAAAAADASWCVQQVEYPEGAEFDSSDGNVYFVKAGQMQMRAMDKLLVGRQAEESLAQAAAAVPTMAATGPLSKVTHLPVLCLSCLSACLCKCCYQGCYLMEYFH